MTIGVMSYRSARTFADHLASTARSLFSEYDRSMENGENFFDTFFAVDFGSDQPPEQVAEHKLSLFNEYMTSALERMKQPPREPTAEEARGHSFIKDIVRITKETGAKDRGEQYDELLADNADILIKRQTAKYNEDLRAFSKKAAETSKQPVEAAPGQIKRIKRTSASSVDQDRRYVERPASSKPLFSIVAGEYLGAREDATSPTNKDLNTAELRLGYFLELIGDHPIDTYTPTDLQAFINLMQHWPADVKERPEGLSAREIIEMNRDFHLRPIAEKTLKEGYLAAVRSVFGYGSTNHDYANPMHKIRLIFPTISPESQPYEPLSMKQIQRLFDKCTKSDFIQNPTSYKIRLHR